MKTCFFVSVFLLTFFLTSKESVWSKELIFQNRYDELIYPKRGTVLGNYYKVDQIVAIEVKNDWKGTRHILSGKKLDDFKNIMKTSVTLGGLETKPGHIFIRVKFKGEKDFSKDYIYVDSSINFDSGTNIRGKKFAGTFRPTVKVNFEKY